MLVEEGQVIGMILRDEYALEVASSMLDIDCFQMNENANLFMRVMNDVGQNGKTTFNAIAKMTEGERERVALQTSYQASQDLKFKDFERAVNVLREKSKKRKLSFVADSIKRQIATEQRSSETIEYSINQLLQITDNGEGERPVITPTASIAEHREALKERAENPEGAKGIPLHYENEKGFTEGLPFVYDTMRGLKGGDLVIVGGKTGTGKTGVGLNLARIVGIEQGKRTYYINSEMDNEQLVDRVLAASAKVPMTEIVDMDFSGSPADKKAKQERLESAMKRYEDSNFYTSEIPSLTPARILQLSKQVRNLYGELDLIVVDYLGRIDLQNNKRNMGTHDELFEIARNLKELASRLNVPVILLAQLNASGELEGAKKIANEAVAVWFWEQIDLSNDDHVKRLDAAGISAGRANYTMKIVKNRRGPGEGTYIHCSYLKNYQFINQIEDTKVMK